MLRKCEKMDLKSALKSASKDIAEVNEWAESEYQAYFGGYFKGEVDLYNRMKKDKSQLSDTELEWILSELPLELFSVTQQLSKLKTAQEVIKISIKEKERDFIKTAEGSEAKKKEEASAFTAEDRLLVTVYDQIADRVSREMSFSKELIMSAKKIWDARRSDGIPVCDISHESNDALPEYDYKEDDKKCRTR